MKERLWISSILFFCFVSSVFLFQNCGNSGTAATKKTTELSSGPVVSTASNHHSGSSSSNVYTGSSSNGSNARNTRSGTGTGTGSTASTGGTGSTGSHDSTEMMSKICIANAQGQGVSSVAIAQYCGFLPGAPCQRGDAVQACAGVLGSPGCVQCGLTCPENVWQRGTTCAL